MTKAGIELLIVPVPAKAAVYPERISQQGRALARGAAPRRDPNHVRFYGVLRDRGVAVIDLTPLFVEQRQSAGPSLYCKTDSHWSGRAIDLAAQAIAKHVRDRPWSKDISKFNYESEPRDVEIAGDLARMLDEASPPARVCC